MVIEEKKLGAVQLALCATGVLLPFYVIIEFIYFLSVPKKLEQYKQEFESPTIWAMFVNMVLLSLFIIQHSLLASTKVKEIVQNTNYQVFYRVIYVMTTSGILWYILQKWKLTPNVILWSLNLNYNPIWWLYISIHTFAWIIIYIGTLCFDIMELLGIKQVYYNMLNAPDPVLRKSKQLQRLTSHMRHPSFLAFTILFWFTPVMSLDRMLLATILTTYMYVAWNTDGSDYHYQKYQYERKHFRLDHFQ